MVAVVVGLGHVAGAGHRQLETVDVKTLLVGVAEQPDEVVLLETRRVELVVDKRTGGVGVPGTTTTRVYNTNTLS